MKTKHESRSSHRLKCETSSEERHFAEGWQKENDRFSTLEYLYGDGTRKGRNTQEQITAAATVIQWLGSNCGQAFLRDLGYSRDKRVKEFPQVKPRTRCSEEVRK